MQITKLTLLSFLIMSLVFPILAQASTDYSIISITMEAYEPRPEHGDNINNHGHRLPGQYVWEGSLGKKGYTDIPQDIIQYEIWDEKDFSCLASFSNETEFVEFLFSLQGEYYIHLVTNDILYVGYISLP